MTGKILVVGGGAAGVAAAVGARCGGVDVVLVERMGFLGGMATAAEVGTVCGLYHRDPDAPPTWAVGGFAREFAERLAVASGTAPVMWRDGLAFLPYRPVQFARVCDEVVGDIDLRLHTVLTSLERTSDGWRASLLAWDRAQVVDVDGVVDATGVAFAAAAAGRPLMDDVVPQAPAIVFTVCGLPDLDRDALRFFLLKEATRAARSGALPEEILALSIVPGWPIDGVALMKLGLPTAVRDDPADVVRLERYARRLVNRVGDWLPTLPGLGSVRVTGVAAQLGLRTGRRPMGAVLTAEHVLEGRACDDGVAAGAWPVEVWSAASQPSMELLPVRATYQIFGVHPGGRRWSVVRGPVHSCRGLSDCLREGHRHLPLHRVCIRSAGRGVGERRGPLADHPGDSAGAARGSFDVNVHSLVEEAARRWPNAVAIVDDHGSMTFAELHEEVEELRARLQALQLRPREGLGVIARNGRGFVVATFAGLGCGAVVMPLFHQLRRSELLAQLDEAPLHAVLDDGAVTQELRGQQEVIETSFGSFRWTRLERDPSEPLVPHVPDAAFVRFTSGTTGRSKGVVISHRAVWERTEAACRALRLGPGDVVVWVLPMAYHFIVSLVMYVRYGIRIAVCPELFATSILDVGLTQGGTLLYASPMHYRMLAAEPSGRTMPTLRHAVSTSSGLPPDVATAFERRYGQKVRQIYGIIECGLPIGDLLCADVHPESVGHALPGYEVSVLDDDGRPLPAGVAGNLAIRGPGMFDAYMSPPRLRADVLLDGWFMTGDLAWMSEAGRVTVSGRRKSMINVAGHKVFPEEVERVLEAELGVASSRVYGVPHPMMGEVVHAEVVAEPGQALDLEQLRRVCQERLSAHKVPQRVVAVERIRMTGSGKVARDG